MREREKDAKLIRFAYLEQFKIHTIGMHSEQVDIRGRDVWSTKQCNAMQSSGSSVVKGRRGEERKKED